MTTVAEQQPSQRPSFIIDAWDFSQHPAEPIHENFHERRNSWFHFQRDIADLEQWLIASGIPEPLIDAVIAEDTRPRYERVGEGYLLILRTVNLAEGAEPEDMLSLRVLFYGGNIYSFRKRPIKSVGIVQKRLEERQGPKSLHDFLVMLIEEMNNRIEEFIDVIEEEMEALEEDDEGTTSSRQAQLTKLHRRMLRLTRFLRPQLTALERMASDGSNWFDAELVQWLHNERDSTHRILESLDMLLEQVWMLREHLQQQVAEKMNRNTYWLSMIAGIFLPISFLTGLFGINIGGMPGVDDGNAFWIFVYVLLGIGVIEFLLLRRLRFW